MLDEKISLWSKYKEAQNKDLFLSVQHKNRREVKAGKALATLKAAYQRALGTDSPTVDHSMKSIIKVAQVASMLEVDELARFAQFVDSEYEMDQLAKELSKRGGVDDDDEVLLDYVREQLGELEKLGIHLLRFCFVTLAQAFISKLLGP